MPNTHGGARPGAGRPYKPITPDDEPQTPLMWLWQEISKRYGQSDSEELHLQFNQRSQDYQKTKQKEKRMRNHQMAQQFFNNEMEGVTDRMDDQHIEITPESLSAFFAAESGPEFTLSRQDASAWLAKQDWYVKSFVDENGPECNGHCDGCNQACATWEDSKS